MIMSAENKNELNAYRETLTGLKNELRGLGLEDDPPTETVTVVEGTQGIGRPLGAKLPVYPDACGIDEEGMKKILFNLKLLVGFTPPAK
jgi:hypothetical protein